MLLTERMSQPPMGWLNVLAPLNISLIVVTLEVSHFPMSSTKASLF